MFYTLVRVVYSFFITIFIPVYWKELGLVNFLWCCDITLFALLVALWTKNNLLVSIGTICSLPLTILWNIDFFSILIFNHSIFKIAHYMFYDFVPLYVRGLSLFHVWLPPLLIWLLYRWNYNRKAFIWSSFLTWIVIPITYLVTEPERNINCVHSFIKAGQNILPEWMLLIIFMTVLPIFVYYPMHWILKILFSNKQESYLHTDQKMATASDNSV